MLTARKLDHLVLRTGQMTRMIDFYSQVFGATTLRTDEKTGLVQLKMGDFLIDLLAIEPGQGAAKQFSTQQGVLDHFCIEVDPMTSNEISSLAAQLCQDLSPRRLHGARGFGHSVLVRDPDANVIEIKFYGCES